MAVLAVGAGLQYSTIAAAVSAAHRGDTINVQPGTYTNDFPSLITGLTIQGTGGIVHLVATAQLPNGKAMFDVAGNTILKNLDFSGAKAAGGSGAGVRYEGGNLKIENTSFENNQIGLFAVSDPTGTITITRSEFDHNGTGSVQTPNIDVSDVASLTMTFSYVHDAVGGSEIRSGAESNTLDYTRVYDGSGKGAYLIDMPNGGTLSLTNSYLYKSSNAQNGTMIAYGEAGSPHVGKNLFMAYNELISDRPNVSLFLNEGGADIASSNNVSWNLSDAWAYASDTNQDPGDRWDGSIIDPAGADTTPPTITATESVSGWTNLTTEHLSGFVSDSQTGVARVVISDVSGGKTVVLGTATLGGDGSWNYVAYGLADGNHSFLIQAYDNDGNVADLSAGPADRIDTVGPTLTAGQSVSGSTASHGIVLSGKVADGGSGVVAVEVFDQTGGRWVDLGQATLTGGAWQLTKGDLTAGSHNFFAVATDAIGNPSIVAAGSVVTVVAATTLQPALQRIIGNVDGGVTLVGTASANSIVTISQTISGVTQILGSVTANATGAFTLISHSGVSVAAINTFTVSATDAAGHQGTGTGLFQLSSAGSDTLSGTAGQSDVFATFLRTGQDTIVGFETTKAVGAAHDFINLSGTGYGSYAQVAPHISGANSAVIQLDATRSLTLLGVSAASLQSSDFRFS